ncbi:DUF551 domain-containing protein [Citrobacter sp. Cu233]|nr:DUF551 domain-containing protein [Citrobacter sp. Cu233]MDM2936051.1 DUF551 domain-containing protein [Citrobacter sp. Cu233]
MADAVKVIDVAIASFGAEPVLYAAEETLAYAKMGELHLKCLSQPMGDAVIPLYTTPPAQVVPENCVTAEHRRVIEMLLNVCGAAFELADDSCQQDVDGEECHVVPDDAFQKLSDALDEIENTLPTEDVERPDVFLAWSAMPREALKSILQAGNSPVTPDGWIPVSESIPCVGKKLALYGRRAKEDCAHYVDEGYLGSNGFFYFFDWEGGPRIDDCHNDDKATVTHWMYWELPEAPQQDVKLALEIGMSRYAVVMQKLADAGD